MKVFAFQYLFNRYITLVTLTTILTSCKPSQGLHDSSTKKINAQKSADKNNVVKVDSANVVSNPNSNDEIIFEGKNNLFEIVQQNSKYFDASHDVIVVKGDNTIIRLININIIDMSSMDVDTLVIVGNNQKYVMDVRNSIVTKRTPANTSIIHVKESEFDPVYYNQNVIEDERPVKLEYFDSLVSPKYAHAYFLERLKTGDPMYYYELAELYLYGVGVEESPSKAIELYEYAAVKDHIPSLAKLGDMYKGRFSIKPDKAKSLYFYKRCQTLGNDYCDEQVKSLISK